jgi:hypothetical protein
MASLHYDAANPCGSTLGLPITDYESPITKFNLPTCANHDMFQSAEGSSFWHDLPISARFLHENAVVVGFLLAAA